MQKYAPLQIHFGPVCAFLDVFVSHAFEWGRGFSFRYTGDHMGIPSLRLGDAAHVMVTVFVCKNTDAVSHRLARVGLML